MAEPVVRPRREARKRERFSDEVLFLTDAPVPGRARAPASDEIEVETVADWTRLQEIESEWLDLAAHAAEANPFYEPWMLLPALRAFAQARRVEVILVRRGGALIGLFPVAYQRGRAELWRHPYCYLTAPLVRAGCERAAIGAWLDALAANAHVVRLQDVPGDGPARLRLVEALYERGWPSLVTEAYTRAVMRCAASSEEFLAEAVAGKRRKEFRRQRARLGELGRLITEELPAGTDPLPWIDEFLTLEAAGWKGRDAVAALPHRDFMVEMAQGAASAGRLQMLALRLDGKPVALKLNLLAGTGAFAFKITFDESYARFSPGVLLELDNVERAHQLPALRWMDSCDAPNRFMINHLWPDRREMQTVFFSTGTRRGALTVALVPLLHFFRRLRGAA